MRQLGLMAVDDDLNPIPATYGSVDGDPSTWDADAVYGCFCDWMVKIEKATITSIPKFDH